MNNKPIDIDVAKKYAKAFMTVYPKSLGLSDIGKIEAAQFFLQSHKRTLFFLQLPQFDKEKKEAMLADLIGHFSLPDTFSRLFYLLIMHNRSFYIPNVLWFIIELYKQETNSINFSVKSAHPLDETHISVIKRFLAQKIGKNIIAIPSTDASLIAGLRLQSNDHIWEYSVRKQLKTLRTLTK